MKKLFILLLITLLCLTSCDTDKAEQSEVSEELSVSEESEISAEDFSPVEKDEVLSAAEALLEKDIELMGVFAGGTLSGEEKNGKYTVAEGKYGEYSVLKNAVLEIYASEETAERLLSYPDYGEASVAEADGKTVFNYTYVNDFAATAKSFTVSLVSFDDTTANVTVSVSGKNIPAKLERVDNQWKLSQSVYFSYLDSEIEKQVSEGWENSIYLGSKQNSGSAPKLTGKFLVLNVFLNDTFSTWEDDQRKKVEDSVDTACEWIVTKSRGYKDANLVIDTRSLFYIHRGTVATNYEMAWLDVMFQETVYVDVNGYVESNTPEGYAGVCVLFHIWKDGQDYLIPCDKENTDYLTYFGERAMFFYSNRGGHSDSAYVSVILQLCGGESFVKREDTAEIRALFPDEILLENTFAKLPLQEYSVSPLTAFLLGWNGYIDTQLIPFTDK